MQLIIAYPSPSGSRIRESSVSSRPDRKCCCRKGTESSNMVATPWSWTILENAELYGYNNKYKSGSEQKDSRIGE